MHLTGHDNYAACGKGLDPDHPDFLLANPDLRTGGGGREAADADSIVGVVRAVNPNQTNVVTHWGFLQRAYEAFEFPDTAERIQKNIREMKRLGYTYKAEKKAK
jgi:hypothetical protein